MRYAVTVQLRGRVAGFLVEVPGLGVVANGDVVTAELTDDQAARFASSPDYTIVENGAAAAVVEPEPEPEPEPEVEENPIDDEDEDEDDQDEESDG